MIETRLKGIFAPVVTPCDEEERFDETRFAANIERLFQAGIHGLYVCGGTGDTAKLTMETRKRAAELSIDIARRAGKEVTVHVGSPSLHAARQLAAHASAAGATAVSAIPPTGLSGTLLQDYYRTLADAAGVPVIIYHIPALTHHTPSFEEFVALLDIPGVAGLKMSDWNLFLLRRLLAERPDKIVYNGYDELLAAGLQYGAHGSIGTWCNLFPDLYMKVYALVADGRSGDAMRLQHVFMDFLCVAWKYGVIGVFEALMNDLDYARVAFRQPFARLTPSQAAAVLPEARARMEAVQLAVAGM